MLVERACGIAWDLAFKPAHVLAVAQWASIYDTWDVCWWLMPLLGLWAVEWAVIRGRLSMYTMSAI